MEASYPHGRKSTPVLYFSQWDTKKLRKMFQKQKYMRSGEMLWSVRPNAEYMHVTMNTVVYESSPWSNSSPSGPLVCVRRACFPSMPSAKKYHHPTTAHVI